MFKNRESIDEFIQLNGLKVFLDLMILDGEIKTYEYCGLTEAVKFKENHKMPIKPIMTRAEAVRCFTKHMATEYHAKAEDVIDFYIASGMLEVKEEVINPIIIDVTDKSPVIIKRNGKEIYKD